MRATLIGGAMLLALAGCGDKQEAAAPDAGNSATPIADAAAGFKNSDWNDRWWKTDNPEYDKGAFVDITPTTVSNEHFTILFKQDFNDAGQKSDGEATPQGDSLPFTVGGVAKSFKLVSGKDAGIPAMATRKMCVMLSPDEVVYCLDR